MRRRTVVILVVAILALLSVGGAYLGIALYYEDHFFEHTTVNGLDVSDLTEQEAQELIAAKVEDYQLAVQTREGGTEVVTGAQIGYRFVPGGEIGEFLAQQNLFAWPLAFLGSGNSFLMEASVTCDEELLRQAADGLECMQEENVTKPQDAYLVRQDGQYVIVPEVEGNELDPEKVYEALLAAVQSGGRLVNLSEPDCYRKPSVLGSDGALRAQAAVLNRYSSISVTYQMGGGVTVELDSATTSSWLSLDEQNQPVFDRGAVAAWVDSLADQYDTIGTYPPFVTSNGETVWPQARTYGWQINREEETEALYQLLLAGESGERSPVYSETAFARGENDLGDTYVEIDYTNQRMWYYKDGALLVETPVVTGNVSLGMDSPEGIFCIVDKQRNAVLKGEGYETPVSYWMPFFGGVGIHDADTWRGSYGGTIYQYSGSHGCINTPTAQAAVIFENIEIGTPVVCYKAQANYGYGETAVAGQGQTESQGGANGAGGAVPDGSGQEIVILDGGGTGSPDGELGDWADESVYGDWADESLYYGGDEITVIPDNGSWQ